MATGRLARACDGASSLLAFGLTLTAVAWAADVPRMMRWALYTEQFLGAMLGLALGLVFLRVRARGVAGAAPPWYDIIAALVGLVAGGTVAAAYPELSLELAYQPSKGVALAAVLLVLILEGLRRVAGWSLTVIVVAFLCYGLAGHLVPGRLAGRDLALDRMLTQLLLDTNGLLGTPLVIATTVVVAFVLFGHVLNRCGGGVFFTDLSLALMGRYRGGAAKIAIVASSIFGSISGSAVSNVATTGVITIPLMRRAGFSGATSGGIEAVASTGGQLMPPIMGASAFLMAEFLQIPYTDVVVAALVPALLYYVALFVQADLRAARAGIAAVPASRIPPLRKTLPSAWFFAAPFAVLIATLFLLNFPPAKAGLGAAAVVAVLGLVSRRDGRGLTVVGVLGVMRDAGFAVLGIILITAAAGLIIGVLNLSGLSFGLTLVLVELSQHSLLLLLVVAALVSIVLGMGMPTIGVYVLLAALVAPSMVELGIEPIAAHLFVLYFGMMSMITPPVAIAAFAAASLAESKPLRTAFESMRFGWLAYVVPFLFVASPSLLLIGDAWRIALAVTTAMAGVWLVSIAMAGHLVQGLGIVKRLAFAAAGLALLVPAGGFDGAAWSDGAGVLLGAALLAHEWSVRRAREG